MINKLNKYSTSASIGTFFIASFTGVLLFFEVSTGAVRATHEWVSIALIMCVVFHIIKHKKNFIRYFTKGKAYPMLLGLILGVFLFVSAYNDIYAAGMLFDLAVEAKLKDVAPLLGVSVVEAEAALSIAGIKTSGGDLSMLVIAENNNIDVYDILDVLLTIKRK